MTLFVRLKSFLHSSCRNELGPLSEWSYLLLPARSRLGYFDDAHRRAAERQGVVTDFDAFATNVDLPLAEHMLYIMI